MSSDTKAGPTPKGQQSLYPDPNPNQPPSYDETVNPGQTRSPAFQPVSLIPIVQQSQVPVVQHVFAAQPAVGPNPSLVTCASCQKSILTKIDYQSSTKTHIMAGLLCCFICWPFAWVPYVMDSCKNANHYCPNCGSYIGRYKH